MTEIEQLIADLEAASEGSRRLSNRVNKVFGWKVIPDTGDLVRWRCPHTGTVYDDYIDCDMLPDPTRSVDAAFGLAPAHLYARVNRLPGGQGVARIYGDNPDGTRAPKLKGEAETPALALCIVLLKVQQLENGNG